MFHPFYRFTSDSAVPAVFEDDPRRRYTMRAAGARLGFPTDPVDAGRIGSSTVSPATKRLGRAT